MAFADLDNHFGGYNHLAHLPRADEALHILRKAASCVKPLMRKRGWRVGLLSEFIPEQANLLGLNINRGQQIQVRLRYPGDTNQFLPFDQVLDTLLHELCHIVWGPHDENFHRLWNELRDEWETLQIRGFSGEGFLGKGHALGGHRIPVEEVRRKARAAAQERARLNKNRYDPGHRLGGSAAAPRSRRRLRDVLAHAAQSRSKANTTKVDSGCATGTQAGNKAADDALRNGFRTKAEMDDANSIAIANALQELYEQEEDDRIYNGLSNSAGPAPGGLTWDPEQGLQAMAAPANPTTSTSASVLNNTGAPARSVSAAVSSRPPRPNRFSDQEVNLRGRPVSRLVHEAESKQQRPQSHSNVPTPAVQYWPESETGASFGTGPSVSAGRPNSAGSDGISWGCPACTFQNHSSMHKCEMCDAPYPGGSSKPASVARKPVVTTSTFGAALAGQTVKPLGWSCSLCGNFMETQWWTCARCGAMKEQS